MVSSIPHLPTPGFKVFDSSIRLDYLIHFLVYFILSLFFMLWKINNDPGLEFRKILLYVVLGLSFAFMAEIYQKLIPGRAFNIIDFMYNSIGFSTGIFSMFLISVVKNKPSLTSRKMRNTLPE
jgi:VanZ family protein